jgi:hypothetical protein
VPLGRRAGHENLDQETPMRPVRLKWRLRLPLAGSVPVAGLSRHCHCARLLVDGAQADASIRLAQCSPAGVAPRATQRPASASAAPASFQASPGWPLPSLAQPGARGAGRPVARPAAGLPGPDAPGLIMMRLPLPDTGAH